MHAQRKRTGLPSIWGLILIGVLAACGSDSSDSQTVAINLSLIVDGRQAQHRSAPSTLFAWIERWFPTATPAWAQSVSDIASIQVQISGPGIPVPASTTVAVSNPTSGQEIPMSLQAPVGPNRTIAVSAFNAQSPPVKIFGGTLSGVNLAAGAPINLEIPLVRLFTVNVQKQGSGSGTVTSTPVGINCVPPCSGQFEQGTQVSLNAVPASGSVFDGWSGDCSGNAACTVIGDATVIARFEASATHHLHVNRSGTGTGTVTSDPNGISCGTSCDADFRIGSTVTLRADPSNGSVFSNWSGGGCSEGASTCTVVMNGDQDVTAVFTAIVPVPMSTLTVEKSQAGTGSGTVTSDPSGINCGNNCSANFPTGDTVRLTATPASGSTFAGWAGACSGTGECNVTMTNNQTVSAQFDLIPEFVTLTVTKSGSGNGTVTSAPGGIDCGPVCVNTFLKDTQVTLTATPDLISEFRDWQGSGCKGNGQCTITMDGNKRVDAEFRLLFSSN